MARPTWSATATPTGPGSRAPARRPEAAVLPAREDCQQGEPCYATSWVGAQDERERLIPMRSTLICIAAGAALLAACSKPAAPGAPSAPGAAPAAPAAAPGP